MDDIEQEQAGPTEEQNQPQEPKEQAPAEEKPTEEVEAKTEEGEEGAKEEQEASSEEKPEGKHKRAGGWQRKIERLEAEKQILLEQLRRSGQQPQSPAARDDAPADPAVQARNALRGALKEILAEERQQERQQQALASFQRRTQEVRAKYPDFEDAVATLDIPADSAVGEAILTSDQGPEIMYLLATDQAALSRIRDLPPAAAAREIGRLEAKLASSTAAPPKPKPAARPPAPPTTVNGKPSGTRSLEDLPISEYKRAFRSKGG